MLVDSQIENLNMRLRQFQHLFQLFKGLWLFAITNQISRKVIKN